MGTGSDDGCGYQETVVLAVAGEIEGSGPDTPHGSSDNILSW